MCSIKCVKSAYVGQVYSFSFLILFNRIYLIFHRYNKSSFYTCMYKRSFNKRLGCIDWYVIKFLNGWNCFIFQLDINSEQQISRRSIKMKNEQNQLRRKQMEKFRYNFVPMRKSGIWSFNCFSLTFLLIQFKLMFINILN